MNRLLLIVVTALAGCRPAVDSPPQPESLGFDYTEWPSVTDRPYPVPSALILMCAPPATEEAQLREADKMERGPHTESAVIVRVSPTGRDRFTAGQSVPVGTVVVKEKYPQYAPGTAPVAVAAMLKRKPGYDAAHGDWEYAYEQRSPEGEMKVVRGRLSSCVNCHQRAKESD